ncbi:MAG: sulfotransferase [Bacteroidota bacterium]
MSYTSQKATLKIPINTRLPDFVIIGAQRSGSAFLQALLHQHPQIHILDSPKEMHFFNRSVDRFDDYTAFFNTTIADKKMVGERSPNYFDMPKARIEYMKKVLPDAKLVVVLREPITRAWSHALMELSNYQHKRLTKRDTKNALLHIGSIRNTSRTDYVTLLSNWLVHYDRSQIFILFQEELMRQPTSVLKKLYAFLVVKDWLPDTIPEQKFNQHRLSIPRTAIWFLQRRYRHLPEQLQALNIYIPKSWQRREAQLPLWRKCQAWLWIVPRNWLFNWTYALYKKRKEDRMPVPEVKFEKVEVDMGHES